MYNLCTYRIHQTARNGTLDDFHDNSWFEMIPINFVCKCMSQNWHPNKKNLDMKQFYVWYPKIEIHLLVQYTWFGKPKSSITTIFIPLSIISHTKKKHSRKSNSNTDFESNIVWNRNTREALRMFISSLLEEKKIALRIESTHHTHILLIHYSLQDVDVHFWKASWI